MRLHQGFSWTHYRRTILDDQLMPIDIEPERSIHAPRCVPRNDRDLGPFADWDRWRPIVLAHDLLVETMYPGYALGTGDDLDDAMDHSVRLAIDIAHLSIQREAGVLSDTTLERLLRYPHTGEVHVSRSNRGRDTHSPLRCDTPLLGWAKEQIDVAPVVVESYWHRLSEAQQIAQLNLLR